jgi:hypothetical protein
MFWLGKQRLNISKNWTKAVICLTENIYYSNISKNRKQNKQIDFVLWSKKKEEQNLFFPFGRFYFAPKKSKSEEQFVAEIGTKYNEESTYNISCLTFQFETKKIFLSIWRNPNFYRNFILDVQYIERTLSEFKNIEYQIVYYSGFLNWFNRNLLMYRQLRFRKVKARCFWNRYYVVQDEQPSDGGMQPP